ncbi:MAG TPA: NAD(P)-binding domain-containing protein [Polyangiaceae bacterium]|jgi:putative flavoprotein involved in K+ transport|nr:NAD(P)-binding domain-containing protein [Polyangiaceae bacterium]
MAHPANDLRSITVDAPLLEEGAAFGALVRHVPETTERVATVVIGGGQAGLAAGYHLKKLGLPFVILDADARTGDSWRRRWDSLRLFSPAMYDSIEGMRFPAPALSFPTKDQMADYLEAYATKFELPIRHSTGVDRVERRGDGYLVRAGRARFEAEHVVVATSSYRSPSIPAFARNLAPAIRQLHSSEYRNSSDLRPGPVLVVGAGNSGAEIALELAKQGRTVWMAGRDVGAVPFDVEGLAAKLLLMHLLFRIVFHRILTIRTPAGRGARSKAHRGTPLIRTKRAALLAAGVNAVPRVRAVQGGAPVLDDGRTLDVANVVWCTGFEPGFSWIELPIFDAKGEPIHDAGITRDQPGFYFLGLPFLYAMSSVMIHGVSRDAARVVRSIARRVRTRTAQGQIATI